MAMTSSLTAGVMGLDANATRLGTISDNIANSNTDGYKRAQTDFTSLVTNSEQSAGFSAGGVQAITSRDVATEGQFVRSDNPTEIAVEGRGLLPVTPVARRDDAPASRPLMLTSTGDFTRDAEGFLVDAGTGLQLLGWPTDETGAPLGAINRISGASLEPVRLTGFEFGAERTTLIEAGVQLPVEATEVGGPADPFVFTAEYFDHLGRAEQLSFTMTPTQGTPSTNTWTMQVDDTATGGPVGTYEIVFNEVDPNAGSIQSVTVLAGGPYDPATGEISIALPDGDIQMLIGQPNLKPSPMQQSSGDFRISPPIINGSPGGEVVQVEIDNAGLVQLVYLGGLRRPIYQIPIADVPNPDQLNAQDNQAFSVTLGIGPLYLWDAGDGPAGLLQGATRELSTVDVAQELTQLIETQRAYSSNATIIRTVDEMLQETTNLKR